MKSEKFYPSITPPLAIVIVMLILAGTVVASEPKETVLHHFGTGTDGAAAYGRVISDAAGNLYGTTAFGGTSGAGIVFELTNPEAPGGWTETVVYSFAGGSDGSGPQSDLNFQAGNLFGTTTGGGSPGNGIVFQLTPGQGGSWTETVLHRFMTSEGTSPRAAVIFDSNGWLYGTLANDGTFGAGAVFRLKPTGGGPWTAETLYTFTGGTDGIGPLCRLVLFRGNLYGTAVIGGGAGVGTVFELSSPANHHGAWTLNVVHTFACGSDGCYPWAGLTVNSEGTFYGTTQFGGLPSNGGTVFALKKQGGIWFEGVVFSFKLSSDQLAAGGVFLGKGGRLYGTTIGSGKNAGAVFEIRP